MVIVARLIRYLLIGIHGVKAALHQSREAAKTKSAIDFETACGFIATAENYCVFRRFAVLQRKARAKSVDSVVAGR